MYSNENITVNSYTIDQSYSTIVTDIFWRQPRYCGIIYIL